MSDGGIVYTPKGVVKRATVEKVQDPSHDTTQQNAVQEDGYKKRVRQDETRKTDSPEKGHPTDQTHSQISCEFDSEPKKSADERDSDNDFASVAKFSSCPNDEETPLFQWLYSGGGKEKAGEISTEDQNRDKPLSSGGETGVTTIHVEMWEKLNYPSLVAYLIATKAHDNVSQREGGKNIVVAPRKPSLMIRLERTNPLMWQMGKLPYTTNMRLVLYRKQ